MHTCPTCGDCCDCEDDFDCLHDCVDPPCDDGRICRLCGAVDYVYIGDWPDGVCPDCATELLLPRSEATS